MAKDKKSRSAKKSARRKASAKLGAKLHQSTCDLFAAVLSQFKEGMVTAGAPDRVRVVIVVATDHGHASAGPEAMAMFASSGDHTRCLLEKALDVVLSGRDSAQVVGVRH